MMHRWPIVLGIALMGLGVAQAVEAAEASCLLRVTYDAESLPLSYEAMDAMLSSSGVAHASIADVAAVMTYSRGEGVPVSDLVSISFSPAGQRGEPSKGLLFGQLTVIVDWEVPDAEQCARTIMSSMCMRLRDILQTTGAQDLERLRSQVALAEEESSRASQKRAEIRRLQQALCEEAGMLELSRVLIVNNANSLEIERRHIEMNLITQTARRDAIAERIADCTRKIAEATKNDPVSAELEKAIMLAGKEVARTVKLMEDGTAPIEAAREAQERYAMMQTQLVRHQREVAEMAGGATVQDLSLEMAEMSVEISALEASLAQTAAKIEKYAKPGLMELVNRYEDDVELQLRISRDAVERNARWQEHVEQTLRNYQPPTLTILGGVTE